MKVIIAILAVCLAIFFISKPEAPFDGGGSVVKYYNYVKAVNRIRQSVGIHGTCASACTMKLGIKNVCVDPSARLLFHQASLAGTTIKAEAGNVILMSTYPKKIKEWVRANHALDSHELTEMSGIEAIELGIRSCEPNE